MNSEELKEMSEKYTKPGFVKFPERTRPSIPKQPGIPKPIVTKPGFDVGNGGTVTVSMSKTEIENLIAKLNSAKEQMESIWDDIKNNDFQRITNSWAGKDCQAYMSQINYHRLSGSFEALGLLANTYKKALDKIEELQAENINIIQSM